MKTSLIVSKRLLFSKKADDGQRGETKAETGDDTKKLERKRDLLVLEQPVRPGIARGESQDKK